MAGVISRKAISRPDFRTEMQYCRILSNRHPEILTLAFPLCVGSCIMYTYRSGGVWTGKMADGCCKVCCTNWNAGGTAEKSHKEGDASASKEKSPTGRTVVAGKIEDFVRVVLIVVLVAGFG
jgi:hypothetical protein